MGGRLEPVAVTRRTCPVIDQPTVARGSSGWFRVGWTTSDCPVLQRNQPSDGNRYRSYRCADALTSAGRTKGRNRPTVLPVKDWRKKPVRTMVDRMAVLAVLSETVSALRILIYRELSGISVDFRPVIANCAAKDGGISRC